MTNTITGIDIRKALLAAGLIPSHFDEQGIFNYITENYANSSNPIENWEIIEIANDHFKVR